MLSSINPLGERGRGQRFGLTTAFYVLGSTMGGLLLGTAGGWLGLLLPDGEWRFAAIAIAAVIGATMDLTGREPPSLRRQVDENWLSSYRGWVYGLGFGFQLGVGLMTIVTSASLYSLVAITVLVDSFSLAVAAGALFGLARAIVILFAKNAVDPASLRRLMRQLQHGLPAARVAVIGCQVLLIGASVAVLV